eukprot:Filipodium_phascolosomae@DN5616_c0_g1_i1.p1
MGLSQDKIQAVGYAMQSWITTEDSRKNFLPDTGRITAYQPSLGLGIRLDGAIAEKDSIITPHYDSLMAKMTAKGNNFPETVARAIRALEETKIEGLCTNIPFILNVLRNKEFLTGTATVKLIDDHPELCSFQEPDQSAEKLCRYLAEIAVNGPMTTLVNKTAVCERKPAKISFEAPKDSATNYPKGFKQILNAEGPKGLVKAILGTKRLLLTDTTMRDAHQSLFATRMRTFDLMNAAEATKHLLPNLFSLENWGGATFDVAYRFLRESPWERLENLREAVPNIPFQMLLRGANAVGYTAYPDNAVHEFAKQSVKSGMDVFRIFDSLNYVDNLRLGIQAVGAAGGVVEAAMSYTGDVGNPNRKPYNLDYYLKLAGELVKEDIHILCIKDMAGLLTPNAARILVGGLRKEFPNTPIHVHSHDTGGTAVAAMVAAGEAGANIVDCATDSVSGLTSQASMGAIVASVAHTPLDTNVSLESVGIMNDYWEHVRKFYAPFEATATLKAGSSDVYINEIPGGQYTNLHMQAHSLGIAEKWPEIKKSYSEANILLGDLIKVTPSSKVVGDMAQFMVQNGINLENAHEKMKSLSPPQSVVEFFMGDIGQPPFGFPKEMQRLVLGKKEPLKERPGATLKPIEWDNLKLKLTEKHHRHMDQKDLLSAVMYPKVFDEYVDFLKKYGDVSMLTTAEYLQGPLEGKEINVQLEGKDVSIKYISKTPILPDGTRNVLMQVNGKDVSVNVKDNAAPVVHVPNPKAQGKDGLQVGAPMGGSLAGYKVEVGATVRKGDSLAMVVSSSPRLDILVVAPRDGKVESLSLKEGTNVVSGDLLVKLEAVEE